MTFMPNTRVLLIVCFVAAFAAGTTTGLVAGKSSPAPHGHSSWLAAELKLTDEQRKQLQSIWSADPASRQQWEQQRKALTDERDKAVLSLLTAEQTAKYQQILDDYNRRLAELSQERKHAIELAQEQTKQILTPDQAKQYDEMLKKQHERGPGSGRSHSWNSESRPHGDPQTKPAE